MLTEIIGNLFDSDAEVLGHGVNVFGKMGAGIAVSFKNKWPDMYAAYAKTCLKGKLLPGQVFLWETDDERFIANIASQDAPGANAKYRWLESGLIDTLVKMNELGLDRIALPRIGCGIGGLEWENVKQILDDYSKLSGIEIEVWSL